MYIQRSVRKREGRYSLFKTRYYSVVCDDLEIEFHVEAPSYMKLFFMLLERGLGKRNVFQLTQWLCNGESCNGKFL